MLLFVFSIGVSGCTSLSESHEATSDKASSESQEKMIPYFEENHLVTYFGEITILDYKLVDDIDGNPGLLFVSEFKNLTDQKMIPMGLWARHFTFYQENEGKDVLLEEGGILPNAYEFDSIYKEGYEDDKTDLGVEPQETKKFLFFLKLKNSNPLKLTAWNTPGEEGYEIGFTTLQLK